MSYTAREVARKLGITKDTLLYYEKEGLLPHIARDKQNRRIYSESDIEWIFLIRCLRDTDMPICKIKQYVSLLKKDTEKPEESVQARREILLEHEAFIKGKIELYQNLLALLGKKITYYDEVLNSENVKCTDYAEEWEHFRSILGERKHD